MGSDWIIVGSLAVGTELKSAMSSPANWASSRRSFDSSSFRRSSVWLEKLTSRSDAHFPIKRLRCQTLAISRPLRGLRRRSNLITVGDIFRSVDAFSRPIVVLGSCVRPRNFSTTNAILFGSATIDSKRNTSRRSAGNSFRQHAI